MDTASVREHLSRVLTSSVFSRSPQARRFLEYVVDQALNGRADQLKAYTIGVQALGMVRERSDPDNTARMQASRVRRLLTKYYSGAGRNDPVVIRLPVGSYEAQFKRKPQQSGTNVTLPVVLVEEFVPLSKGDELVGFTEGLTEGLTGALVRFDGVRVWRASGAPRNEQRDYVLSGSVTRQGDKIRVLSTLREAKGGERIWSRRFDDVLTEERFITIQDEIASAIAARVADLTIGAAPRAAPELGEDNSGYRAIRDFHQYLVDRTPENLQSARERLSATLKALPNSALMHASYASLLAHAYAEDPSCRADLVAAEEHARRAVTLRPECQQAHFAKAFVQFHHREAGAARRELLQAIELNPAAAYTVAAVGNLMALMGHWEEGLALVAQGRQLFAGLPGFLNLAECVYLFHERGDPAAALQRCELLDTPKSVWPPLVKAACFASLGRRHEGRRAVAELVAVDPNFGHRAHRRLSGYFFHPEMVESFVAALAEAGLSLTATPIPTPKTVQFKATTRNRPLPSEVRVGVLQSLSGTMAICETHLVNAAMLAIDEINCDGGLLGRPLRGIVEDGRSDPNTFCEKAEKLVTHDGCATLFGCWTSSSRKAVRPVVERHNSLLWYPVQYEGLERSRNIIYTGSCLNQQIEPAVRWAVSKGRLRCFLIGSDYVYPRTANRLIRGLVEAAGGEVVGEAYRLLGTGNFAEIAATIRKAQPSIVYNTVNGSDNIELFRALSAETIDPEITPVMSFSLSELELEKAGGAARGHLACWSYFQSVDAPENHDLVRRFRRRYGESEVLSDPAVTAYAQVHLWRQVVEAAGSLETNAVLAQVVGSRLSLAGDALEVSGNNHVKRRALIGKIRPDNQFEIVWRSKRLIAPQPWLGVEETNLAARDLILGALSALPDIVDRNASLESAIYQQKLGGG